MELQNFNLHLFSQEYLRHLMFIVYPSLKVNNIVPFAQADLSSLNLTPSSVYYGYVKPQSSETMVEPWVSLNTERINLFQDLGGTQTPITNAILCLFDNVSEQPVSFIGWRIDCENALTGLPSASAPASTIPSGGFTPEFITMDADSLTSIFSNLAVKQIGLWGKADIGVGIVNMSASINGDLQESMFDDATKYNPTGLTEFNSKFTVPFSSFAGKMVYFIPKIGCVNLLSEYFEKECPISGQLKPFQLVGMDMSSDSVQGFPVTFKNTSFKCTPSGLMASYSLRAQLWQMFKPVPDSGNAMVISYEDINVLSTDESFTLYVPNTIDTENNVYYFLFAVIYNGVEGHIFFEPLNT